MKKLCAHTLTCKRPVFIPIPKKGCQNAKKCSNYYTIVLTSHASNVMLKILQARIQQFVNWELPDTQAGFWRVGGTRDQLSISFGLWRKRGSSRKNIYFCFIDYAHAFDCVDHNKLWKILKEMGTPDHCMCLLRNLMQVKKQQLQPDMEQPTCSKVGKKYNKAVYCHSAYLILCRVHLLF